jgi:hypothetical protein
MWGERSRERRRETVKESSERDREEGQVGCP